MEALLSYALRDEQTGSSKLKQNFVNPIGPGGFEPPLTDPKSAVLPLDEGPVTLSYPEA